MKKLSTILLVIWLLVPVTLYAQDAARLITESGLQGGLVVHVGSGDGTFTADLRINDRFIIRGLDQNEENVHKARKHIQSIGLYGDVSIEHHPYSWLPYPDNLVNILLIEDPALISREECMRVLSPKGALFVKQNGKWNKSVKSWPKEMDEWTHHLHDSTGNPVANDRLVESPQHLQWTAGPLWARSHGWTPSVSAMVSAGGRLFYICDEAVAGMDGTVPGKWFLVARDAFSGVELWKKPIPEWDTVYHSGLQGNGGPVSNGRFCMPQHLGKRLVAIDDTVYVTLGATAPISALDAATGKVKQVYPDSSYADEFVITDGCLVVSINPTEEPKPDIVEKDEFPPPAPGKHIGVIDIETGECLWKEGPFAGIRSTRGQDPFGRFEMAAGDGKVFGLTPDEIICLDLKSGDIRWKIPRPPLPPSAIRKLGFAGVYEHLLVVMVYQDGVVLLAQPEPNTHHTYHTMPGTLYAFDADNGNVLWEHGYGGWGHCTQPDVFVVDDAVWTHEFVKTEYGHVWGNGLRALDSSKVDYKIQALDLKTGERVKELPTKDIFDVGHHHRCYRNKITERFLLSSRRGVEFVDLSTGENWQNHWVRSGCLLGNLPCNGMLYVAPHPCACYLNAKLTGFNALAPERASDSKRPRIKQRLSKGPAFGKISNPPSSSLSEWPTYRHDFKRSGSARNSIGDNIELAWQSQIGVRLSAPVIANGNLFLADINAHTVHALECDKGESIWKYTAGGRVNAPPTIYKGMAIFGSTDGRVYSLRASDGELVWRFEAAPKRNMITAFNQLESTWPVPGNILIHNDQCWFAAGRLSYIDDGIFLYALEPATGKVIHEKTFYHPDPDTGKMRVTSNAHQMPGLMNDIPVTDGNSVFIRQMKVSNPESKGNHLYSTAGFLDSTWFNRTSWQIGKAQSTGMMVLGEDVAFGVEMYEQRNRDYVFTPGEKPYNLKCMPIKSKQVTKIDKKGKPYKTFENKPLWKQQVPIRITAMVRAGDRLYAAGTPNVVDSTDIHSAWEGRKGGILAVIDTASGKVISDYKLASPPVWDGMAVAGEHLYISLLDGSVVCWRRAG